MKKNEVKKKCVTFSEDTFNKETSPFESLLDQSDSINHSLDISTSQQYLKDQITTMQEKIQKIEDRIENQLMNLKAFDYSETDDLETRIKKKIQSFSSQKNINPNCWKCLIQ